MIDRNEKGQIVVDLLQVNPPDQAWFWTERWQKMEREVDEDLAAGSILEFENRVDFFNYLDASDDAEDSG